jgi:CRP/FNR family transcriptional regulator
MEKPLCKFCAMKSSASEKLTHGELEDMGNNCAKVQFEAGDIIIKEGALSTNVAYIKSGLVKIHVRGPVREKIMKIVKAPAYLCLPSSFGDKVNTFSATAIETTRVCFIDLITFKSFIYGNGDFAYQIIMDMSKGEIKNFHNLISNAQKQNMGRVADAVLFFANDIYGSDSFDLPVSRQDLADLTSITRESASRILTDFHREQILDIKGHKISILNKSLLQQISENG